MVPEVRTEMKKENFGFFLSKNIKKTCFVGPKFLVILKIFINLSPIISYLIFQPSGCRFGSALLCLQVRNSGGNPQTILGTHNEAGDVVANSEYRVTYVIWVVVGKWWLALPAPQSNNIF